MSNTYVELKKYKGFIVKVEIISSQLYYGSQNGILENLIIQKIKAGRTKTSKSITIFGGKNKK